MEEAAAVVRATTPAGSAWALSGPDFEWTYHARRVSRAQAAQLAARGVVNPTDPESLAMFDLGPDAPTSAEIERLRAKVAKLANEIDDKEAARGYGGAGQPLFNRHRAAALELAEAQRAAAAGSFLSSPVAAPKARRHPKMRQQALGGIDLGPTGDPRQIGMFGRRNPSDQMVLVLRITPAGEVYGQRGTTTDNGQWRSSRPVRRWPELDASAASGLVDVGDIAIVSGGQVRGVWSGM